MIAETVSFTGTIAERDGRTVLRLMHAPEILRNRDGTVDVVLDESTDHAIDLFERLKKTKGESGKYASAARFLRLTPRPSRGNVTPKFA